MADSYQAVLHRYWNVKTAHPQIITSIKNIDNIKNTTDQLDELLQIINWYNYESNKIQESDHIKFNRLKELWVIKSRSNFFNQVPNTVERLFKQLLSIEHDKKPKNYIEKLPETSEEREEFHDKHIEPRIENLLNLLDHIKNGDNNEDLICNNNTITEETYLEQRRNSKKNEVQELTNTILKTWKYNKKYSEQLLQILDFTIDDSLLIREWYN